jgi:hypothetical protein
VANHPETKWEPEELQKLLDEPEARGSNKEGRNEAVLTPSDS